MCAPPLINITDVFTHENTELFSPMSEYGLVSPLSPGRYHNEAGDFLSIFNFFLSFENVAEEIPPSTLNHNVKMWLGIPTNSVCTLAIS